MRLNLGCGSRPLPKYVNVDIAPLDHVDVVHDLDVTPWPWNDGEATKIVARDIFEHVENALTFMTECHRVLKDLGILHLHTPHYRCIDAFTDPTHRRFPTEHTFDYWIPGTVLFRSHNAAYGGVSFERLDMHLDNGSLDITLRKIA